MTHNADMPSPTYKEYKRDQLQEDVLGKVDKFNFPKDFIILDMDEDNEISIILGRPFLASGRTFIDVEMGELTMRVHDVLIILSISKSDQFIIGK